MNEKRSNQMKWLFLPLLIVFIVACEKVVFEPVVIPNNDKSFAADIQPIFEANCVSCHPPTKGLDLTAANAYNELIPAYVTAADSLNAENSRLYRKLVGSSHSPRTSDIEKNTIYQWISQGAKNN